VKIDLAGSGPDQSPVEGFVASQNQSIRLSGCSNKHSNDQKLEFRICQGGYILASWTAEKDRPDIKK
jgi:hypothetical protein